MTGTAAAPASSGNLGPGFDVLAIALDLMCRVSAEPAGEWRITQDGYTYEPAPGDLIRRAVGSMADGAFHFEIDSAIPRGKGLGSSSAVAVAAGAAALRSVGEEPTSRFLFDAVAVIEGHADNTAAAVYGGLVAVGGGVVGHLEIHPDLAVVVGVPDATLATTEARLVLTDHIGRDVAARSLARIAFLVDGLRTADPEALRAAGGDELHEQPRHHLSPLTARLMSAARDAGALHAAWSGAGPAAIAFAPAPAAGAVEVAMREVLDGEGEVLNLGVASEGWR